MSEKFPFNNSAFGLCKLKNGKILIAGGQGYSKTAVLYDPETNIRYGSFYLKYLFNKFPDLDTVLACYNAGEGNVSLWINEYGIVDYQLISFKETANYINKVKNNLKIYQSKI